jgi:tripartite-type tricarboxylate transporter receptor subunit TctC
MIASRKIRKIVLAAMFGLTGLGPAAAQTYPARPVRAIVAFAPGGVVDTFARLMAQKLSQNLGKSFYVDNLPGASGNIGTAQAAKAEPDGYTLFFAYTSYVVNPTLFDTIPYDPYKDFLRWLRRSCFRSILRCMPRP